MRTPALTLIALALVALPIVELVAAEPPRPIYKAGDFVVVVRPSQLKVADQAVDSVEPGVLMGVDQVQGDWLWVTREKSGWLPAANVIPAQASVEYFTAAIRRAPADARLYARRGVARALNEDFPGALKDYDEAIRLHPTEALYYGDRGCFHMAVGNFDLAIADFGEEIKRIDSEDPARRALRLGWLNQRLGEARTLKSDAAPLILEAGK